MGNCMSEEIANNAQQPINTEAQPTVQHEHDAVDALFNKLENAQCKSMLKKYLTKEIFEKLKDKKTKQGCDLKSCIKSGCDNLDSGIGVYASDSDAYVVFADLLNPVITDYHKSDSLDRFQ
eukprot:2124_1